ncbi:hypothetical protein, partial [Kitasatospora griseola]|uniref:hypothetical protein n=1 Tax=Kitasatospora griseola TaxID=2064 RepID=UPI003826E492
STAPATPESDPLVYPLAPPAARPISGGGSGGQALEGAAANIITSSTAATSQNAGVRGRRAEPEPDIEDLAFSSKAIRFALVEASAAPEKSKDDCVKLAR